MFIHCMTAENGLFIGKIKHRLIVRPGLYDIYCRTKFLNLFLPFWRRIGLAVVLSFASARVIIHKTK